MDYAYWLGWYAAVAKAKKKTNNHIPEHCFAHKN